MKSRLINAYKCARHVNRLQKGLRNEKGAEMIVLIRHAALILFVWLMVAGVCYGKQVYLKDGGIIDAQSAWQQGNKVFVKVNRDIVADFNPDEVDLRRTFPKTVSSPRHLHRAVPARAASVSAAPATAQAPAAQVATAVPSVPKPAALPPPPVATPAAKPAAAPPPAAPPAAKEPPQTDAPSQTSGEKASPPDKAELQRRSQEAAKMMAEAILSKDSEKMKKALEMQKSAMPQQGGAVQKNRGFPLSILLIIIVVCILIIAGYWVVFQKAGVAGWKCLIPFYNMYVLMQIAGKPGWWMFLLFIPLVGVAIMLFAMLSLAKKFGRSELFGIGLLLLPMVFFPLLAFGGSEYEG